MSVISLNKENFDATITNNSMVLVDFWAHWCGPCRVFADVYHNVSEQYPEIIFAKVDIEAETELASDFNIRSIPFLMIFRGDVAVYAEPGALTEPSLLDVIERAKNLDLSQIRQSIEDKKKEGK